MALCQTKLVVQYIIQFKLLAAPLKDLLEKLLKGAFMNGLVDEIKFKVRLFGPKNLGQTMDLSRNIEKILTLDIMRVQKPKISNASKSI